MQFIDTLSELQITRLWLINIKYVINEYIKNNYNPIHEYILLSLKVLGFSN